MAITKINIVQVRAINKQLNRELNKMKKYKSEVREQLNAAKAMGYEAVVSHLTKALVEIENSIYKMSEFYKWVEDSCDYYSSAQNNTKDNIVITEKNKSAFEKGYDVLRFVNQVDDIVDRNKEFIKGRVNNIYEFWSDTYKSCTDPDGALYDEFMIVKHSAKLVFSTVKSASFLLGATASPVFAINAILAYEDLHRDTTDWIYAIAGEHDKIGSQDQVFRDLLVEKSGDLGEMLGDRTTGEVAGEFIYTGMNAVDFLDSVESLFKTADKATDLDPSNFGEQGIDPSKFGEQLGTVKNYIFEKDISDLFGHGSFIRYDTKYIEKMISYDIPDLYYGYRIVKETYSVIKDIPKIIYGK